jgi:hypothetical protein
MWVGVLELQMLDSYVRRPVGTGTSETLKQIVTI